MQGDLHRTTTPSGEDGETRDHSTARLVKISDLARLSGVPAATIKHYIREGLLPGPAKRTHRNMAYYDARLAARVRTIKELQKSRFLPLRVIAEVLEPAPSSAIRGDLDDDRRRRLGIADRGESPGGARAARSRPHSASRSREQVLSSLRIGEDDLAVLEAEGLIRCGRGEGGSAVYAGADLRLLEVLDEARARGLGELFDLEALPAYAGAVRELVRVEIHMFGQRVCGGAGMPGASLPDVARHAAELGERLLVAMRETLLVRALAEVAMSASAAPPDRDEPG